MAQADRIYKLAFRKHFTNHEGNFPLSRDLRLGDYGTMKNGFFVKIGNVENILKGFKIMYIPDTNPTQEEFQSEGQVTIDNVTKGEIVVGGVAAVKASLEISFSAKNAIYFASGNVYYNSIDNLPDLGKEILSLYKNKKWEKRYVIVTRILEAEKAVIVISGESGCKVTIEAQAPEILKIDLTDAQTKLGFSKSDKVSYKIIANNMCQIGFGVSRVYNPIFNDATFKSFRDNSTLFAAMDESRSIDENNLAFGDVMPQNYEVLT